MPAGPDLQRAEAPPDEAVFATAHVATARRSWLPAATLAVAVVALIGSAILARAPADDDGPDSALVAPARTAPAPTATVVETERPRRTSRPATGAAAPALLQLEARPNGRYVFVNGDVFSMAAFVVVVSLEAGDTATATRTVRLPGGSTAFLTGANPRFQVQFDVPADAAPLSVRAVAYDVDGDLVASLHQPVPAEITVLAFPVAR